MLPWLIGAAVLGVGAAILSSSKDRSSDSSSSSSDYDYRVEEEKERERQAAIDNSQRLIDQKFSALKSKWQIKNQFKNTLVSSKHNNNVSKSGQDKLISSDLITKHEKAMDKLTNNIQELNSMLDQVTGELKAAGISLSHIAIQDQSATPSATKAQETKAKAKTTDNTKATATKVASKAKTKASEPVKAESKAKAKAKPATKAAATKDAIEVKPKRTRRTKAQIEADMATKDASSDANSKSVAKKATTKRQRISRA